MTVFKRGILGQNIKTFDYYYIFRKYLNDDVEITHYIENVNYICTNYTEL